MIVTDIISIVLLAVLLFWSVYNGSIIYIGIKNKRKTQAALATAKLNGSTETKYSLIVPTKNEESVIRRCLDGILNLDYPKDQIQVVVVDGNSTDRTCDICAEYEKKYPGMFKVISEQTTQGKPAALNLALPYLNGDVVGVFDADSLPERDVLAKVSAYLSDEKIIAVQGMTTL
jgi:cellulose synthase/poly-beta-1,6-N-acetylglucosamine synthase-like glycosyltransferase